jgi:hypothetical protein
MICTIRDGELDILAIPQGYSDTESNQGSTEYLGNRRSSDYMEHRNVILREDCSKAVLQNPSMYCNLEAVHT